VETLWSPWRYKYIASSGPEDEQSGICVFCEIAKDPAHDEGNFVLHRAAHNFIVLNLYPYITGHLLIVPFEHVGALDLAAQETTNELMDLTRRCQTALREVYRPPGFNLGMNQGTAGGAGIVNHIHLHIMPRWSGDTNFMTTIGNTRVIPEELAVTWEKLRHSFKQSN